MCENETLLEMEITNPVTEYRNAKEKRLLLFKILRRVLAACNQKKINFKQIKLLKEKYEILNNLEILTNLQNYFESPESLNTFKENLRKALLTKFYQECGSDASDLIFFAAATFDIDRLQKIIASCDRNLLYQPRYCDSILVFTLKYGNIADPKFLECMSILIEAGADINKPDFNGKFAIDHIFDLYHDYKEDEKVLENLKQLSLKLLEKGIFIEIVDKKTQEFIKTLPQESNQNIEKNNQDVEALKAKLFFLIGKENSREFLKCTKINELVDSDDGEHTLLQFACKKSGKMHFVVKFLLERGADPNRVTELNRYTPLELAARNNNQSIVQELLQNDNLKITSEQFNNFVRWRSSPIKLKIFEMFLESDKLNPNFTYETTGNTPLHYATRFSHKKAIQKILKHPEASLLVPNKTGKKVLDMINVNDLKIYFDSCLALDRYAPDFTSTDYKMLFRFKSLIFKENHKIDEVKVLSKISKNNHLEQLLAHPLLHTFIELKWFKIRWYYRIILFLQGLLFLSISVSIYHLYKDPLNIAFIFSIIFTTLNFFIKIVLIIGPSFRLKWRFPTLYEFCELLLVVTLFCSFRLPEFRAFAFVEMSIILLLTAGYHPKIAKWSVMLKTVFKSFTILMLFFSLIIVAFAAAFHVLFSQHQFFETFWKSLFITYVMITGEFNIDDVNFTTTAGYVIFFLFAIFMALVIVNFWTGVAVTDIGNIEKDAEINAFKNVIKFLVFVQKRIYDKVVLRKCLYSPFLFSKNENEKYEVNFYINKENQFEGRYGFAKKVGMTCLEKIRSFCCKQEDNSNERNILMRLDEISKVLTEMKCSNCRQENNGRNYQKKIKKKMEDKMVATEE